MPRFESVVYGRIPDVTLLDQDTGVVDGLGETKLVDTGLQTALQEVLNLQGQDVIELHAGLVEHTDTDKTANQGIAFEQTLGVLLVEGEKLTAHAPSVHCLILPNPDPAHRALPAGGSTFREGARRTEQLDESWTG